MLLHFNVIMFCRVPKLLMVEVGNSAEVNEASRVPEVVEASHVPEVVQASLRSAVVRAGPL